MLVGNDTHIIMNKARFGVGKFTGRPGDDLFVDPGYLLHDIRGEAGYRSFHRLQTGGVLMDNPEIRSAYFGL